MSAVVLGHIPFALAARLIAPVPASGALPYILAGALLHTGYQLFLLAAYRMGDLSQVYPLAIVTGCFIASYSLVDGMGAREAGTSLGFYGWLSTVNGLVFAAVMALRWPSVLKQAVSRNVRQALFSGGASFLAYAMVTWAFTQASIPLVTALRETSIVFALLLGTFFLKERLDLVKVLATLCSLLGAGLLRLSR